MNHYEFKFSVSMLPEDDENTYESEYVGIKKIVEWYNSQCKDYALIESDVLNPCVTYLTNEDYYKLEFDMDASYIDAKFQAEMMVNPDDDGNYPVQSEGDGKTYLIMGSLIGE